MSPIRPVTRRVISIVGAIAVLAVSLVTWYMIDFSLMGCCGAPDTGNHDLATALQAGVFLVAAVLLWLIFKWGWGKRGVIIAITIVAIIVVGATVIWFTQIARQERDRDRYMECNQLYGVGSQDSLTCQTSGSD